MAAKTLMAHSRPRPAITSTVHAMTGTASASLPAHRSGGTRGRPQELQRGKRSLRRGPSRPGRCRRLHGRRLRARHPLRSPCSPPPEARRPAPLWTVSSSPTHQHPHRGDYPGHHPACTGLVEPVPHQALRCRRGGRG
jgi:hypothetical protein